MIKKILHQRDFFNVARTFKNITSLLRKFFARSFRTSILPFVSPSSTVIFPTSKIHRASFLAISLTAAHFPSRCFFRKSPLQQNTTRRYQFASVTLMCAHRHEKIYVFRRIIFAHRLVRQVSAGL